MHALPVRDTTTKNGYIVATIVFQTQADIKGEADMSGRSERKSRLSPLATGFDYASTVMTCPKSEGSAMNATCQYCS